MEDLSYVGEEEAEHFHGTADFKTNSSLAKMSRYLMAFLQQSDLNPHTAALFILALGCTGQMGFPKLIDLSMRVTTWEGIKQSDISGSFHYLSFASGPAF